MLFHIYRASDYATQMLYSFNIDEFDTLEGFEALRPHPKAEVRKVQLSDNTYAYIFVIFIDTLAELLAINEGRVLLRNATYDEFKLPIIEIHDAYLD